MGPPHGAVANAWRATRPIRSTKAPKGYIYGGPARAGPEPGGGPAPANYQAITGDFNGDGTSDIGRDTNVGTFFSKLGPNYASNQSSYPWAAG